MNISIRSGACGWWVAAAAFITTSCGGATSDEADPAPVAVESAELKNGSLYDGSTPWRGVVGLAILTHGEWNYCSGQVVSAQTILTAGHCVKLVSPNNPSTTWVSAWRQTSATGYVTVMPPTWTTMRYNPDWNNSDNPFDMGLIIAPSVQPLQNVTSSDAAVLAKTTPGNVNMWAFGFGYYNSGTNDHDYLGRFGVISPNYASKAVEYWYENTGSNLEICAGDSGGPLKSTTSGQMRTYGVAVRRTGGSGLCQPVGHWSTTAHNLYWLRGKITGTCVETSTTYSCW
jgi:V8-like Glu-specific endopeptidase